MPSSFNKSLTSTSSVTSNPNQRSSEISNPMRRSFNGNPFAKPSIITNPRINFPNTPANSPSDFQRRNAVGDLDDKENGKGHILKSTKVRSPAVSSKSGKNFMSPTISASRKKVLIERNEAAPTSIPSTDPKTHIHKVTFAEPLEKLDALLDGVPNFEDIHCSSLTFEDLSGESETVCDDANVPLIQKNDTEFSSEIVDDMNVPLIQENSIDTEPSFETDCVNLDPTFRLSPTPPPLSSTDTIFMPPYDPKTNYLSPRPQFLHYKPKSRMEVCSEREFEDSFISGSFSDTEDTQSEGSHKESDDVTEAGRISETNPSRTFMPDEASEVPKPRFSMRSKAIALVLLLSVAFISMSVTNSPVIDHTVFEDFYELEEFSEFAKANFDRFSQIAKAEFEGLARNFNIWLTKQLSSISELISNVGGVHNLAQVQHCNLTALQDYIVVDQYPIFVRGENERVDTSEEHPPVLNVQESDAASEIGTDKDIEDISAEHYEVYEEQVLQYITAVENALDAPESEEFLKGQPATMIESEQALRLAEAENLEAKQAQEDDANFNLGNASDASQVLKHQPAIMIESEQALQLAVAGNSESKQAQDDDDDANFNVQNQPDLNSEAVMVESEQALQLAVAGNSESKQAQDDDDDANFNVQNQPDLNSEAVMEVYGAGNVNTKQAQESDAKFNVDKQRNVGLEHWPGSDSEVGEIRTEVYDVNAEGKSVSIDAAIRENEQRSEAIDTPPRIVLYLLLCGGTVLIAGAVFNWSRKGKSRSKRVTCPSEMSSFEKSSSYNKNAEAHSLEKKRKNNFRRESLASSSDYSMGSPSYGSLTVLEKIPSKQGNGDEETITPVRRSSRIRNIATSPS